jgi:hemerythrin-like metal-binding protein
MAILKWNEAYSVNVAVIDAQHKKLMELINQLYEAMKVGQGQSAVPQTLDELVKYTSQHFAAEERLMEIHGYPGLLRHRGQHLELLRQVEARRRELESGNGHLAVDLMMFLNDWLSRHVLEEDKQYAPFLNEKGVH